MQPIKTYLNDKVLIRRVQYVLIFLFVCLIGLDIYLALDKIPNNTISNVILDKTDNGLFVLTYFWGAIAAHLFFTKKRPKVISPVIGTTVIIALALLIILFNIEPKVAKMFEDIKYNISIYSLSMVLGFVAGVVFWRQKHI